jgi:hypothetical protein
MTLGVIAILGIVGIAVHRRMEARRLTQQQEQAIFAGSVALLWIGNVSRMGGEAQTADRYIEQLSLCGGGGGRVAAN